MNDLDDIQMTKQRREEIMESEFHRDRCIELEVQLARWQGVCIALALFGIFWFAVAMMQ